MATCWLFHGSCETNYCSQLTHQNGHCQTLVGIPSAEAKTSSGSFAPLRLPQREYKYEEKRETVVVLPFHLLDYKEGISLQTLGRV